ncbi:hypothetical protein MNBD_GAMMA09-3299 [hydrothermal vent metagenome]|uniref:Regulatory protein, RpfE type n=1 Tax=hydrothermal vent metagenome TaxID=652676 RepID=A0A3B0XRI4_9ZZZZ
MNNIDLVVPGLLGPFPDQIPGYIQQQLLQPEFRLINQWLSRAKTGGLPVTSFYETLVYLIHPSNKLTLCQLSAQYDGIDISQGYYYRVDPVHFKAESDHAVLLGAGLLLPELYETHDLIASFNAHFLEDKISLHATDPNRWYLKCDRALELEFNALDYSLGRDIKHFMPTGKDALWWRKIINEAQMLFFQHEINQSREAKGQLGINGLWLWDMTFDNYQTRKNTHSSQQLVANDAFAAALAKQAGLLVEPVTDVDAIKKNSTVVLDQLYESVCYADVDAWFQALKCFCNESFPYITNQLKTGEIDELNIFPCDGRELKIKRMSLLKFWKPSKPLYKHISVL